MYELTPTDDEISTNSVEFSIGQDSFPSIDVPPGVAEPSFASVPDTGFAAAEPASEPETPEADTEAAESAAHAEAAREAQAAADEFVAQGDYKAAAQARETAEDEAWAAGDSSMLDGSDSTELEGAAYKQEVADSYRAEQAYDIEHGDYEAAKEDAQNVAYATGDADYKASGDDHTAQADKDVNSLDWAVWNEKNADSEAQNAAAYAAEGDFDNAERYAENAGTYQAAADDYAVQADPAGDMYNADPSSDVASGGSYDSSFDAGAVDTGFDAGVDTSSASTYDPGTDDV